MYRRPLPEQPYKQTMAGTLFHAWVEQRFGVLSASDELDAIELSKDGDQTQKTVEELREIFENSRFAKMTPHSIEAEIQVTIKGNTFICKLDAVFKTDCGYEIVDWKTGKPPVGDKEIAERKTSEQRLPRQANHYAQIVGHFLAVKNSTQIAGAMDAHFQRLNKYHSLLVKSAVSYSDDSTES
jgi:DNA helicase-2/ATP-dependent DNA helicase PcrA